MQRYWVTFPQYAGPSHLPHLRSSKDTEGQVQAKAAGWGKLDLVVVQRTVREDVLLNGCLHRALQGEAVNSSVTFAALALWRRLLRQTPTHRSCFMETVSIHCVENGLEFFL